MDIQTIVDLPGQFITKVEEINKIIQEECIIKNFNYADLELVIFRLIDASNRIKDLQQRYAEYIERELRKRGNNDRQ